ncbi:hypothetical protein BG000_000304, partial [Podila horticola]
MGASDYGICRSRKQDNNASDFGIQAHDSVYSVWDSTLWIEDWVSGIEHISVGDSLVACSTEFSGSVLVFSLATGSLVYEIPGLYQPSKMCMTDFFLLTGGRGAWNRGGRAQAQAIAQGHGHHGHGHGQGADRLRNAQNGQNLEVDEYMSCCVNVWDLRTG